MYSQRKGMLKEKVENDGWLLFFIWVQNIYPNRFLQKGIDCGFSLHPPTLFSIHKYCDVIMSSMASQSTGVSIVYITICSNADQRKHQSSASLAFVRGIHRWAVNSRHKGSVTRKMFSFDDGVMMLRHSDRQSSARICIMITGFSIYFQYQECLFTQISGLIFWKSRTFPNFRTISVYNDVNFKCLCTLQVKISCYKLQPAKTLQYIQSIGLKGKFSKYILYHCRAYKNTWPNHNGSQINCKFAASTSISNASTNALSLWHFLTLSIKCRVLGST